MTDIEQKALALVNEVAVERGYNIGTPTDRRTHYLLEVVCRAIEQHEAFRQEVSDAVAEWHSGHGDDERVYANLTRFIIAKPDPLVEALDEALWEVCNVKLTDRELRAVSLRLNAKRGGKIIFNEGHAND